MIQTNPDGHTHTCTRIHLSKNVTAMSHFTASGLDNIHVYNLEQTPLYSIHVVGCNINQCNFTSQHNCDVVKYVNYVNFYVDFAASN